jgi:tyrosine-protein kinase Etk/Wzc
MAILVDRLTRKFSIMRENKKRFKNREARSITSSLFQFLPYWPLFIVLLAVTITCASIYIYLKQPVYRISANVLIKDEKKGADDSRLTEAFNIYSTKKIVENEVEVLHSRSLVEKVVKKLDLYAPTFEKGMFQSFSAYNSSPISVEAENPDSLEEVKLVYFNYNPNTKEVVIAGRKYPLNRWIDSRYGRMKFGLNQYYKKQAARPLYFLLSPPKIIADKILSDLEVSSVNKLSSIVAIQYKDIKADRGENILNALIDVYNDEAVKSKNALAANTLVFIETRIKSVLNELDSIEDRVQRFRSKKSVIDLSEQGRVFLKNAGENELRLTEINMQLAVLDQVQRYVLEKDNTARIVPGALGVNDPILSQLLQKLYTSEIEYQKLKKTTGSGNPMMISLQNEIENIRPNIMENIKNQRTNLQASRDDLKHTNGVNVSELQEIPEKERQLTEVSRQKLIKSDMYSFLLRKREETALSYISNLADNRIIDRAEASIKPISPNLMLVFLIALIFSFVITIGLVSIKELLSTKILFRSEIEKFTNVPVVAEITKFSAEQPLIAKNLKTVSNVEQFRQLGVSIALIGKNISKKKILVTSSITNEGKSFVSTNLALTMASSGKKVVLLDLDLSKGRATEVFNLKGKKGSGDFLEGICEQYEIIYNTPYNNLFVAPSGTTRVNSIELLLNGNLSKLFVFLENAFDYIIVDSPPINQLSDSYVIADFCNITLFLVRHKYTPKALIQYLDDNKKIKAFKNIHIVFNSIEGRGFVRKGYGIAYGYGYENVYDEHQKDYQNGLQSVT